MLQLQTEESEMQRSATRLLAMLSPRIKLQLPDTCFNSFFLFVVVVVFFFTYSACCTTYSCARRLAILSPIPSSGLPDIAVKGKRCMDGRCRHVTSGEIASIKDRGQPRSATYVILHA
jgi:hypothetical protein